MSLRILEYIRPKSIEEAYGLLQKEGAEILGGTTYVRLSNRTIKLAIDLQDLNLDTISVEGDWLKIGSMVKLGDLELSPMVKESFNGYITNFVSKIWSFQLRNVATVGGTVVPKWGFSDFLTGTLALECELEFFKAGRMKLEDYLSSRSLGKDILTFLYIRRENRRASFKYLRNSEYDFSIVNVAVSAKIDNGSLMNWRISVGARPGVATLARRAMKILDESHDDEHVQLAVHSLIEEIPFGGDFRWSGKYRQEVAAVLFRRAIGEVIG